ncbi:hypothetical protein BC936DRAFT_137453 [Jimgerdemannia flammicorona]|uniref:Protein kinase domain-containing protein n=1 Tax=Jimgerdemannia flammicorona TaxID=994334 RepID=A0A433CXC6_9FUNG|nr:hypothetical protein BC936DRAFT_137453 [Jimgerdemannia flammicorona]
MDWLQAAIDEKRIDYVDFNEEFHKPVFIARGGFGAIYRATSKKRGTKQYALNYCIYECDSLGHDTFVNELRLLRQVDDEDFVARCYGVSPQIWLEIDFLDHS